MATGSEAQVARARALALAQHHLIEVLQSEDRYTRTLIESALAVAEADAAQVAATSVELNGKAPVESLQQAADEAVKEVAAAGKSRTRRTRSAQRPTVPLSGGYRS